MKKRMITVLALATTLAVLATSEALAASQSQRPLTLTKSANADAVTVGDRVTFTLTETNNQPSDLTGVGVRDPLPANVNFVSATSSQGTCSYEAVGPGGGPNVQCDLGTLPSGATATMHIVVVPTQPGTIKNTAIDIGENQASASVSVSPADGQVTGQTHCGPWDRAWYVSRSGWWYYWWWRWCHNPFRVPGGWYVDWAGWHWFSHCGPECRPGYHYSTSV
jgi:uncharacterized repeat protein (TIGR01451 family)